MSDTPSTPSIVKRLQLVFTLSIILLIVSLIASIYSTQRLIANSRLVNHTNEVLIKSELIISYMKDAETGHRGFMVTRDIVFLDPYNNTDAKVQSLIDEVKNLTRDSETQQKNLDDARILVKEKFNQMDKTVEIMKMRSGLDEDDQVVIYTEMVKGKKVMDDLRIVVERIKTTEKNLLEERVGAQARYITYTPILIVLAALISIIITIISYVRIKNDLSQRLEEQKRNEEKYHETSLRIIEIEDVTQQVSSGNYTVRSKDDKEDELGKISKALNHMTVSLEKSFTELNEKDFLQTGAVKLRDVMREEKDIHKLSANILSCITSYVQAPVATIYVINKESHYPLAGSYAAANAPKFVEKGKGLAGEVLKAQKTVVIDHLPADYMGIHSSLGSTQPVSVVILPLVHDMESIGVIEIGMVTKPSRLQIEFLENNLEAITLGIHAAINYMRLQELLEETQAQTEELQAQHNELENLNNELEEQTQKLLSSEDELRAQQKELQQTNIDLEERTMLLEEKNTEINKKAEELAMSTRYKSEFLANMSHELRTPLNSILLLSRLLKENNEKNLQNEQVEYAEVIHNSGNSLLGLIDEILDLSKIEAGKMSLEYQHVSVEGMIDNMRGLFSPVAREKELDFNIIVDNNVPPTVETDKVRLEQVLKNLLSNALKFTRKGSVSLHIYKPDEHTVCYSVKDTGIGIPKDKQQLVFEAFQQADGSTRRKFGGTGLGLSISRELVKLLQGDILLNSKEDEGSEFTICLPIQKPAPGESTSLYQEPAETSFKTNTLSPDPFISTVIPDSIPDDRKGLTRDDRSILIVEDDTTFAKYLQNFARKKNYKTIVSVRGDEAIDLAKIYLPTAILLDIQLPIKSGWEVMETLKNNASTRHIPVHIISSLKFRNEGLSHGAIDFTDKPVDPDQMHAIFEKIEYFLSKKTQKVLVIEENIKHAKALAHYLDGFKIHTEVETKLEKGLDLLKNHEADCVILDMGIPDQNAYDILERAKKDPQLENLPIIVFTGKSLSLNEEQKIKKYADSIIVKTAHSYQRMLDEVSLFLHLVEDTQEKNDPSFNYKKAIPAEILKGKKILVVDDDVRNIFSLSKSLEAMDMTVITAIDGKDGLQKLQENTHVDIVLLDMMMPRMDGYETAKIIRQNPAWKNLPVIAVTAKAMTGDREKCIDAGASDYITKPVDIDQLLSLLRVWLYEKN